MMLTSITKIIEPVLFMFFPFTQSIKAHIIFSRLFRLIKTSIFCVLLCFLSACAQRNNPAPVVELRWQPLSKYTSTHIVRRGETLYAVAFRYDQDYRSLAALNHLRRPFTLRVGQKIQLHAQYHPKRYLQHRTVSHHFAVKKNVGWSKYRVERSASNWYWPIRGRIVANFLPSQGKKGIDIAGKKGDKIRAASNGVVAYAGGGLQGYGNLIIIKHNNEFLTAYGNNAKNLVKEGQRVQVGQVIAEMGIIDRRYWGVHFEMRKAGNPVNPLNYLRKGV